jgi:O-antigen/teichoic acid export membrane protein
MFSLLLISKLLIRLRYINSDKGFSEILTGSAFALIARAGSAVLGLVVGLVVAQVYGARSNGVLAIVQSFMVMVSIFAIMGTNVSILRLIPEHIRKYSVTSAFRVYRKAQCLVAASAVFIGCLFWSGSDLIAHRVFAKTDLSFYIGITALCVLFRALLDLNTQAIRGLRMIRTFALMQVLPNFLMLFFLGVAVVFSGAWDDPVYAQLAAWGGTSMVGVIVVIRVFRRRMQSDDFVSTVKLKQLLKISAPMLMTASMNFFIGQAGVLILGIYRPTEEVGFYSIAVKLAMLTTFVLQAINSMAAPKFSELYHTGKIDELFRIAKKSTKLIFWTTVPIFIVLVFFGEGILSLYGREFSQAYVPMVVLLLGQFVNSVAGSTGYFMNMTGHESVLRNVIAVASMFNLVLCFILIPSFGALGAAISGSLSLLLWNSWVLLFIRRKFGTTIGYMPFV